MGGGFYLSSTREARAKDLGYYSKSRDDIFTQNRERKIHQSMLPKNAILRESRDSDDHPESLPIILGLDFTGSMGTIPHELIKDGLPSIMTGIIEEGVEHPQVLFLGIGDHECDRAPLQVGQFESSDELLDQWLTRSWIEEGGGGNDGESYLLAWYFAAQHTEIDSFEKRGQKGFLITIGDEPGLRSLPSSAVNTLMENNNQQSYSDRELLAMAQEKYNVYHINVEHGYVRQSVNRYWNELLGENCITVQGTNGVAPAIKRIIVENYTPGVISEGDNEGGVLNLGL